MVKGKTLRNIFYAGAFLAGSILPGCEKEALPKTDGIPPEIKFLSPLDEVVYNQERIIPVSWEIKDHNGDLSEAWINFNNNGRLYIPQSGSMNYKGKSGYNEIEIGAKDSGLDSSKSSIKVYVWDGWVKNTESNFNIK
jgi:hypothetical protein